MRSRTETLLYLWTPEASVRFDKAVVAVVETISQAHLLHIVISKVCKGEKVDRILISLSRSLFFSSYNTSLIVSFLGRINENNTMNAYRVILFRSVRSLCPCLFHLIPPGFSPCLTVWLFSEQV